MTKNILLAFILFSSVYSFADTKKQDQVLTLEKVSDFRSLYRTYDDYFKVLKTTNLATKAQIKNITSFLNSKGINTKDSLVAPKIEKNKLSWGSVVIKKDNYRGNYLTSNGVVLKRKSGEAFDETFIRTFKTLEGKCLKNCVSLKNLFFETAYADFSDSVRDIGRATVDVSLWLADKVGVGVMSASCTPAALLAWTLAGGVAMPLKTIIHPLRKFIYDGTVTCNEGKYEVHSVRYNLISPLTAAIENSEVRSDVAKAHRELDEAYRELNEFNKRLGSDEEYHRTPDEKSFLEGSQTEAAAFVCFGIIGAASDNGLSLFFPELVGCVADRANCPMSVSDQTLKKIFNDSPPACTKKNAKLVEKSVRAMAEQIESNLLSASSKKENTPKQIKSNGVR